MRIYLLLYWFIAASTLRRAGCDQQLLGVEDARGEASAGAKSICYTYITTILVTITAADSSDTRDDNTNERHSSAFYSPGSLAGQTQTQTPAQAGNDLSSFGTPAPPGNGTSNSLGQSNDPTRDAATSAVKTGDESGAVPPEGKPSSDIPLTSPPNSSRGGLTSTANTDATPYHGTDSPSDASLGRDPTAPTSPAGTIKTTTPGNTGDMDHSGGTSDIRQDSTTLGGSSTPRSPGGSGDVSPSFFATTFETTGPTVLNPSTAGQTRETNPTDVIISTTEEGPATTSVGTTGFPASTRMPGSDTKPSRGPTNPMPTSQTPPEATPNQPPASTTTQNPSSLASASQVILSIEAVAGFGPASPTPRGVHPRRRPWKRDDPDDPDDPGFVGDGRAPNPDSCADALRFRQADGRLERRGRPVAVDPGVAYLDLADYPPGGSITTRFSVVDDRLRWDNAAFDGGRAGFCQVPGNGTVYAVFTAAGGPRGCAPVVLVVYKGTEILRGPWY